MLVPYILTFIEGILTFISPCILPMLPIYFIYLAGSSDEKNTQAAGSTNEAGSSGTAAASVFPGMKNRINNRMLINSLGFVTGFTIIFVLLGATVTSLGHFLQNNRTLLQKVSGLVMIIFGLNFTGILKIRLLNTEKRIDYRVKDLKFLTSILFGMAFGFGWTPCLGAFLGSALLLAGNSKTILQGASLLLLYSVGLGVPFIISAIVFDKVKAAYAKIQKYSGVIGIVSGILLIAAGILVFTDSLKYLY